MYGGIFQLNLAQSDQDTGRANTTSIVFSLNNYNALMLEFNILPPNDNNDNNLYKYLYKIFI